LGGSPADAQPKDAPIAVRSCKKCAAPLAPLQDWCLQCGAGAPGSLSRPSRRAALVALVVAIVLVLGAGAAAYAALSAKGKHKAISPLAARLTPAATATPAAPVTPTIPPATTTPGAAVKSPGTPTTIKATPPKIPLQTPTPSSSASSERSAGGANEEANNALFAGEGKSSKPAPPPGKATIPAKAPSASTKPSGSSGKAPAPAGAGEGAEGNSGNGPEPPSPILLDTNAAATYNPYSAPATGFGDPSLAIDGEAKTAWVAPVDPATAPKMAVGLVLDCKSAQKVGSVTVKTATTGITVTVFAANGHNLPASITDPAWKRLSGAKVLKKKTTALKLKTGGASYRFILLWITKAPAGSTPSKPGSVSIDELELFP
jgi:hypothetical protein